MKLIFDTSSIGYGTAFNSIRCVLHSLRSILFIRFTLWPDYSMENDSYQIQYFHKRFTTLLAPGRM